MNELYFAALTGTRIIVMSLPSSTGCLSTVPAPSHASANCLSRSRPICWWLISRPRKRSTTLTLLPSPKKRSACLTFVSKSCCSMRQESWTSFSAFKAEFAVIHYAAHGRLRLRRHEHQIKPSVICHAESGVRAHYAELLAFLIEKSDFLESNRLINEIFFCCYCSSPPKIDLTKQNARSNAPCSKPHKMRRNIDRARGAAG